MAAPKHRLAERHNFHCYRVLSAGICVSLLYKLDFVQGTI